MMEHQELIGLDCYLSVGASFIVREFDLIGSVKEFDHGANLTTYQLVPREISEEGNNIKELRFTVHFKPPHLM